MDRRTHNTRPAGLVTISEAMLQLGGVSRSTIYKMISSALLPPPVHISSRRVAFPADELAAVLTARRAGFDEGDIRELVGDLTLSRQQRPVQALSDSEINEYGEPLSSADLELNRRIEPILADLLLQLRAEVRGVLSRATGIAVSSLRDAEVAAAKKEEA